jgi:beta-lactam-binding protein with PASTA domain
MEQESGEVADPVEEETRYYADIPNLRGYTESQARDWGVRNSNWVSFASRNGGFNASADCLTNGWGTVTSQTPAPGQVELTGGRIQVTVAIDCG